MFIYGNIYLLNVAFFEKKFNCKIVL